MLCAFWRCMCVCVCQCGQSVMGIRLVCGGVCLVLILAVSWCLHELCRFVHPAITVAHNRTNLVLWLPTIHSLRLLEAWVDSVLSYHSALLHSDVLVGCRSAVGEVEMHSAPAV